jgi:hypothetical protein
MEAARNEADLQRDLDIWRKSMEEDKALLDALEESFGSLMKVKKIRKSEWHEKKSERSEKLTRLMEEREVAQMAPSGIIKKAVERRDRAKIKIENLEAKLANLRQSGGSRISKGGRKVKSKRSVKSKKNKRSKRK